MEIFEAIFNRRSIRKFKPDPVPEDILYKILDAGRWAPSACNRQLWEFVIVREHKTKKRIANEACFGQKFLIEAPCIIVVFYDDRKERREEVGPRKHDSIQSAAAAIQNMLLSAYSMGIGSLWVCGIKKMLKLNDILSAPRFLRPIAIVAFGYPKQKPSPPARRPLESFIHFEKFRKLKETYPDSSFPQDWKLRELAVFRSKICWFGGVIGPDSILEKCSMDSKIYNKLMDRYKTLYRSDFRVLDIMPYAGGFLAGILRLSKNPKNIYAFELHEGSIRFIKENLKIFKLPEPNFILNNEDHILISIKNVDIVTCFFRLERVPQPESLIYEMNKSLNIGGRILFASELMGFIDYIKVLFKLNPNIHRSPNWNIGPIKRMTKTKVNKLFKERGFKIISQQTIKENILRKRFIKQILGVEPIVLLTIWEKVREIEEE